MVRLGLALPLRGGREGVVRLIVTAVAVAIGVAILAAVLADFSAFRTTNRRPCWECTSGAAVSPGRAGPARRAELWNYGDDVYAGQTIERLWVAPPGRARRSRRASPGSPGRASATTRQISVIAAVEAFLAALLGAVAGLAVFALLRPAIAGTAVTSARYFPGQVALTALDYAVVLLAIPAASAIAALLSLRRVRISPLGVTRRVTPPAPRLWRILPLAGEWPCSPPGFTSPPRGRSRRWPCWACWSS